MEFCQDREANILYSKQSVVFNGQDSECHSFGGFFPLAWGRRAISGIYHITPNHALLYSSHSLKAFIYGFPSVFLYYEMLNILDTNIWNTTHDIFHF